MVTTFVFICAAIAEILVFIDIKNDKTNIKTKVPLWAIIVWLLISFIPVLQLFIIIGALVLASICHNGYSICGTNQVSRLFKSLEKPFKYDN